MGGRSTCPDNCATCDDGCPRQAKNSSDVVFWPEAIKRGVVLKTRARVREITVNKHGLADGALYYDADGTLVEQKARIVVMACNGIGTPRVLLNSKSKLFPQGLANGSGLVGKNLMGHPSANVSALFEHENAAPKRELSNGIASEQFYEGEPDRGFARGFWLLSTGYTGPVHAALGDTAPPRATAVPAALRIDRTGGLPWGTSHHAAFAEQYQHTVGIGVLCEELPLEENRVELHPSLTDEDGIPGVKLFYKRSENTEKMIAFGIERGKELLLAAGASRITTTSIGTAAPGHYLGTARMGDNPQRSVVDKWCRAHEVKNLFVVDGSVFTTSGSTVPTSTIQANALRIADYIKNNARTIPT
jgi:choline dehydrogenase-like flavoprotein